MDHFTHSAKHDTNLDSAQRDIVADLKRQLNDLERETVTARSRADACKQALDQHGRTEKDLRIQMQRAEDYAEALRDALDKENAEDGRIDALQEALKEAEGEMQLNEGSFRDSEAAMAAKLKTLMEIRREIAAKDTSLNALKERMHVAESEKKVVENKRRTLHDDKNAAIALIDNNKAERANIVKKREQVQARVFDYNEKASMVSSRVPVDEGETPRSLERKLERLDRDLNDANMQYVVSLHFSFLFTLLTTIDWERLGQILLPKQPELRQRTHEPCCKLRSSHIWHK